MFKFIIFKLLIFRFIKFKQDYFIKLFRKRFKAFILYSLNIN
jgi:hypothetical protein